MDEPDQGVASPSAKGWMQGAGSGESKPEPVNLMPETGHQASDVTADLQES